jgi:methylmalonyl-CoA/ethylmalonyl-CoA epimerase
MINSLLQQRIYTDILLSAKLIHIQNQIILYIFVYKLRHFFYSILFYQMPILRIEHIGIAVSSARPSIELFTALLGSAPYKTETVETEGVKTIFFEVGGTKIELLEATHTDSPVAKFLAKKGEGIHHIALEVDSLEQEIERLQTLGFALINATPKTGADNKRIAFLHPKHTGGVLIELCQTI